jgi:hypothetical protein
VERVRLPLVPRFVCCSAKTVLFLLNSTASADGKGHGEAWGGGRQGRLHMHSGGGGRGWRKAALGQKVSTRKLVRLVDVARKLHGKLIRHQIPQLEVFPPVMVRL